FGYLTVCGLGSAGAGAPPPTLSAEVDALEVLSGRDVAAADGVLTWWFDLLNSGRQVVATGGSGSRTAVGVEGGSARTFVHCAAGDAKAAAAEIAAAVRRLKRVPNAFVTNGPFVEVTLNGRPIGSLQSVEDDKVRMELRVRAPLWIDVSKATVYCNGHIAEEVEIPEPTKPLRCDRVLGLEVPGDCWFVVVVEGERPLVPAYCGGSSAPTPFAVTNPFWVDADGDGEVHPGG
ncbi:MAG: CehA/McbA family metallohydrolase, partial [Planctomycetota bacterium]